MYISMEKPPLSIARPCHEDCPVVGTVAGSALSRRCSGPDLLFPDEGTGDGTVDKTRAPTAPGSRSGDREHYPGQTVMPNKRNNGVGLIGRPLAARMNPYNMIDPGN